MDDVNFAVNRPGESDTSRDVRSVAAPDLEGDGRNLMSTLAVFAGAVYEVGDKPLRAAVESLGGWPVLDAEWTARRAATWTLETVLGRLRGVHNTPLLVETFVAADDKNSSHHDVTIVTSSSDVTSS